MVRGKVFKKLIGSRGMVRPFGARFRYYKYLKILWTPVSTGVTTFYETIRDEWSIKNYKEFPRGFQTFSENIL